MQSAEDSTLGQEIQIVLSFEFSNNFKTFHESWFSPIEQNSPPAWNLHTSDLISDSRKLDSGFEYL